jgi:Domain of unknown function (DUF4326)
LGETVPKVLNRRDLGGGDPPSSIYIGRPGPLGNPFVIGIDGNRKECLEKHMNIVLESPTLLAQVRQLKGLDLVCWCAPEPCHGDFYLKLANMSEENYEGFRQLLAEKGKLTAMQYFKSVML